MPIIDFEAMVAIIAWVILAWIGGTAAILGSLMTIAALLFWLVPEKSRSWQLRLQLLAVSVAIAGSGLALLVSFPFPAIQG